MCHLKMLTKVYLKIVLTLFNDYVGYRDSKVISLVPEMSFNDAIFSVKIIYRELN